MTQEKKTKLRIEVENIWSVMREDEELKEVGVKLISKLKSEVEGRGKVPEIELDKRRRVFKALQVALKED